ncbi:MAG TPA: DUF3187 family protein [Gemmatimonadales bacterium]
MRPTSMRLFAAAAVALGASAAPAALAAQDIPPYVPANPLLASRSALYLQPFIAPHGGWQVRILGDYYNAIEVADAPVAGGGFHSTLFDAEVLQADVWATKEISSHAFVIANLPIRGGYNGFLDGFLNWYHRLIGIAVPARNQQPDNQFQWRFTLPDTVVSRDAPGTFIGDARVGGGLRFGRAELIGTVTAPTGNTDGWTRHTIGTSVTLVADVVRNDRITLDAGATGGITPRNGPPSIAQFERTAFAGGFAGLRWRFAGRQAVFGTAWVQSANWQGTGWDAWDNGEVTTDFGFLLRPSRHGPELQLGMTQDLIPRGPAMDVGFTIGLRWH